ncbi:capsular polysaccharide synthesis protein [Ligilactobacillus saerimneri]|uniref:capsular polysaccharide synthesis protein n=1 Tax=Ligilactobacillus saerimneri TaxID=228229 RepID=UPI0022A7E9B5|nr:capsular polysaccharide synthesis protein [Ligilactobacillus saerimneri]MCZ0891370.1 capsular polysaccharide synthesis protein [Ligilactobacillus saerimneri]MDI9206541.1 capsular polysaccharide synthesis protein [Ligilactobacillus saerimneri]
MNKIQKFKKQAQQAYKVGLLKQYLSGRLLATSLYKLKCVLPGRLPVRIHADIDNYQAYRYLQKRYRITRNKGNHQRYDGNKIPKIIWWCWFQGEEKAPELAQICLASVRKNFNDYRVVVVTNDNLDQYIEIPEYIKNKYAAGIIRPATYSDIVRFLLLAKHGGVWIDASVLCTNDRIKKVIEGEPFFAFRNDVLTGNEAIKISSWFLSAVPNHPLVTETATMMIDYWRTHNFIVNYFLIHLLFSLSIEKHQDDWNQMPVFNNVTPHTLARELNDQYSKRRFNELNYSLGIHKLNNHQKYKEDGTLYGYLKHLYLEE